MPGSLHRGVCYPSQTDARQAACSDYPLVWAAGSSTYSLTCSPSVDLSATAMTMCRSVDGGTCLTLSQPWPYMPDCDFSGGNFAADFGIVSLALFVTIYGGKQIIRLFENHHNPD